MDNKYKIVMIVCFAMLSASLESKAAEAFSLEGTWSVTSYVMGENQTRYQTEGYMMFGEAHWMHVMFLNWTERAKDFSEAHHGTYEITGEGTLDLSVDMELHMDPALEFQDAPVWYGDPDEIKGASYRIEGDTVILEFPSTTQLVLQKIE